MRILFALHTYLPAGRGGTEIHVHSLARVLAREHVVRVVCREADPQKPDGTVTRDSIDGIDVARINCRWDHPPEFEWIYKNPTIHSLFEKELVEFKPDLVHIHHLTGLSTTIIETIKAGGLPLVFTLHDFWTICPRGQRMTKELTICDDIDRNICFHCLTGVWPEVFSNRDSQRTVLDSRGRLAPQNLADFDRHMAYILGLVDVMIAPSYFHRERMLDFPLPGERIVALPHGLDHSPYRGVVRAVRPVKRIGFIGSVIPVKGCHVLVDAFKRLARADLELHIHGEGFPFHDDRNYFERLKSRVIGQRNVFFHGAYRPSELPRILANLDILVVPSLWWESFCLTIREGMLAGLPVIASDLGAMREALDGERDGLLFHAGDAQDLAERLTDVIQDDHLRERLSNRGSNVKTIEQYAAEILPLYERAMAVSGERAGTLVVAPPSFPKPVMPAADAATTSPAPAARPAPTPAPKSVDPPVASPPPTPEKPAAHQQPPPPAPAPRLPREGDRPHPAPPQRPASAPPPRGSAPPRPHAPPPPPMPFIPRTPPPDTEDAHDAPPAGTSPTSAPRRKQRRSRRSRRSADRRSPGR